MSTIAATLTPEAASSRIWDVVVVGAGCAGAMAAREIARRGVSTLLVDKASFPRWKVCGCCINQRAQTALASVGLGDLLANEGGVSINSFHVGAGGKAARIPIPQYVALSRERLDAALVREAIDSGASFLPKAHAMFSPAEGDTRNVALRIGERMSSVAARLVLAADGLGGMLLKTSEAFASESRDDSRIGAATIVATAPEFYKSGIIYMACGARGYVGLVRLEDGRLDIAAAFEPEFVRDFGGLFLAAAHVLADAGFPGVPSMEASQWRGTPALTRRASTVAAHRAFVLGDAAGYVEPFTGEGMSWALASGVAIADLACEAARDFRPEHILQWTQLHRSVVRERQYFCKSMAAAMRRPDWVRRGIGVLSYVPALARPAIRRMNAPERILKGVHHP